MASQDIRSTEGSPVHVFAEAPPRSRRAILAAALGGLAGSVATALGRPAAADAAAGDALRLGQTNYAGTAATRVNTTSSGGAFWMTQNGSGSGVRGDSTSGHGGVFTTAHPDRYGLYAQQNAASTGTGAAISADGGQNTAVNAYSTGPAVNAISTDGNAVYGQSGSNVGVFGYSSASAGVYGQSNDGIGVSAYSANDYGVYGASSGSHAGYFNGSCYAASFTTVASPTVRLDHPLAPATQVLAHATVISDAPATMYSGTVTTDAAGEGHVQLPAWFDALNTDLRYQLTPFADVRAWVKSKVDANRFVIATSEPNTEVCWLVTGVRRDVYALAHPLAVESTKTGKEKGRYLNPLELGQPASKGVDWEERQRASESARRSALAAN